MTITVEQFRTNFKAFTNSNGYENQMVQFWLDVGYARLPPDRWGDLLDQGVQMFTAHNLSLELKATRQAKTGGIPGSVAPISSKTAAKVSVTFDNGISAYEGAGHYNLTIYGQRFWELVQIIGAGPIQVGIGGYWGAPWSGQPYPGPLWPWSS